MDTNKILILGSGAREDAISWKLSLSPSVKQIYVYPGNIGSQLMKSKICQIDENLENKESIVDWCKRNSIGLVVVGPENYLAEGIADLLIKNGILCFGPTTNAARIESSKSFAKELMIENHIPTARWASFENSTDACEFIRNADFKALVIKADGLASGKGVHIASNVEEACLITKKFLEERMHGQASSKIVVEELLEGFEISLLCFSDGTNIALMPPCQDHKRLHEFDKGPNTGGMGAYCPCNLISHDEIQKIKNNVLQTTINVLKNNGTPFIGVLYAGLMMTVDGPKVLEFNSRFGDPETQVLMMLLQSDLHEVLLQCVEGRLNPTSVIFDQQRYATVVVVASPGYPENSITNLTVKVKNSASTKIFWAGAKLSKKSFSKNDNDIRNISNHYMPNEICEKSRAKDKNEESLNSITNYNQAININEQKLLVENNSCINDINQIDIITTGGRVLSVVAMAMSLEESVANALSSVEEIQLEGKQFRRDIGWQSLKGHQLTYEKSGVDVRKADNFVSIIKCFAQKTVRTGCLSDIGSFGGMFDLTKLDCKEPILISGTDGVGTKLKIAQEMKLYKGLGIDLVAMCVNDVLCHGAQPIFFLDYFATGILDVDVASQIISGISDGCKQAGCALIGGETAEMPGTYNKGDFDLAGFAVGVVDKSKIIPSNQNLPVVGDVLLGLSSSGVHSNGFSLIRKIIDYTELNDPAPFQTSSTLGEVLLTPTRIYVQPIHSILKEFKLKAIAHITGGGLPGNLSRILPDGFAAQIDAVSWPIHDVFKWIYDSGDVSSNEMVKTFNCGIGLVLIIDSLIEDPILNRLKNLNYSAFKIGSVINHLEGREKVEIINLKKAFGISQFSLLKNIFPKKKVAVFISGTGTNLDSLIKYFNLSNNKFAHIVLVISNVPNVKGVDLAHSHNIITKIVNHKNFQSREAFESQLNIELESASIDIICLAGFMRVLTETFVSKWKGHLLNIHPSLLPSFKGLHPQQQALDAGVKVTGCTAHFVSAEIDGGTIIMQEPVDIHQNDDANALTERIKKVEHLIYPRALELVVSGKVKLDANGKLVYKSGK